MVKYTGRGLVVKRPGVLSKVQILTLVLGVGAFTLLPTQVPLGGPPPPPPLSPLGPLPPTSLGRPLPEPCKKSQGGWGEEGRRGRGGKGFGLREGSSNYNGGWGGRTPNTTWGQTHIWGLPTNTRRKNFLRIHLLFIALLEFLPFSFTRNSFFFLSVFPFFPKDFRRILGVLLIAFLDFLFRGSASIRNPCFFCGFPCDFSTREREDQGA